MNFLKSTPPVVPNAPLGKPARQPMKAKLSVAPGLDQVIKQRLTSVITHSLMGIRCTAHRIDDLNRIDSALTASGRRDIYQVTLYGYELGILYSFLLEQEQFYGVWSADHVPARASRIIRADLRSLLTRLHALCRQIDVFADRPLSDR